LWILAVMLSGLIGMRGVGVQAQAAVSTGGHAEPDGSPDPLLGSLSFTSSDEPVEVTAQSLEFDYRTRVLTYRGDVIAEQGDVQLRADSLTLDLTKGEAAELHSVVAEGNVRFAKGDRRARADHAVYDQSLRRITLSRNAVLEDPRGNVSGDRVQVYLDDGRTVIDGGKGRVRAVLKPSDDARNPKADRPSQREERATP
jgi:lipopolysaccharide export system protein LptA